MIVPELFGVRCLLQLASIAPSTAAGAASSAIVKIAAAVAVEGKLNSWLIVFILAITISRSLLFSLAVVIMESATSSSSQSIIYGISKGRDSSNSGCNSSGGLKSRQHGFVWRSRWQCIGQGD